MIIINKLNKLFNDQLVLDNINIVIQANEVVAVTGSSGSGKSTFLRCINNLEEPTSGQVIVNNNPNVPQNITQEVGMVFQHFSLFPHLNVLQNIIYAPVRTKKITKSVALIKADKLLSQFNLLDKKYSLPKLLSGGQQQRIAIARSLIMEPKVLLFDEPTSALDPEVTTDVINIIKQISEKKITIIIVTHEMKLVKELATRVLFFNQAKIILDNNPDYFFNNSTHPKIRSFLQNVII